MDNKQEAKLGMYRAVISYCNQNGDIIASLPALQTSFNLFTDTVGSIIGIAQQKAKVISGFAENKTNFRKALTLLATSIASSISAYASAVNNTELKVRVKITASDLSRMRDGKFVAVCSNIMKLVKENLAALADYNVSPLTVSNFEALINEFNASIAAPRNEVVKRAGYGKSLKGLFKQADSFLKNRMDKIIATLWSINPEFYQTYKSNRIIIDPRTTHTQIKGIVTDNNTGEPIGGALIEVTGKNITVTTNEEGRYVIKPIANGTHTIRISKVDYHTKTITGFIVKLGQVTTVNVALSPAV